MPKDNKSNVGIYMAYLVRYVQEYPVTVEQLRQIADERNFPRLATYFSELPSERTYQNARAILDDFAQQGDV